MSDFLLPCPFCGEPGEIRPAHSQVPGYPYAASARCTDCHTSACGITPEAAAQGAADSWNTRAGRRLVLIEREDGTFYPPSVAPAESTRRNGEW